MHDHLEPLVFSLSKVLNSTQAIFVNVWIYLSSSIYSPFIRISEVDGFLWLKCLPNTQEKHLTLEVAFFESSLNY